LTRNSGICCRSSSTSKHYRMCCWELV